jgi:Alpha amylase, catalytic domain
LSREAGRRVTLADIDDATIDGFAEKGFDWIWLLSVWQIGAAGRAVSRGNPQRRVEFKALLPDLTEDDICGSGFAITAYTASDGLGGETGLAQFRERLAKRGIKLLLDFVANHTAPDHPWVKTHPDYYAEGSEEALAAVPQNYLRVDTDRGPRILAYGRDPNFPGWPDTLQLNYSNTELQAARIDALVAIAGQCDGVRCDMAMLQSALSGSFTLGNFTDRLTASGGAAAVSTYTDRPMVIYSPLTGVDFLKRLMTPIPPSSVLFMLQSGYSADRIMPIMLDSINCLNNESNRLRRPADPKFTRLVELMREGQLAGAIQIRIERPKDGAESSLLIFGPSKDPQLAARGREIKSLLGIKPDLRELRVNYGGFRGKTTRSTC